LLHSGGIKWSMEIGHSQAWMGPAPRLGERAASAASRVHKVEQQAASLEESLQALLLSCSTRSARSAGREPKENERQRLDSIR